MNYTIHQLKIFLKVLETKSITRASEELFMTQPAVSIQLKNFQDQFDIPLTEIVGRRLYVTDFGKEIGVIVEKTLDQLEEINYKTLEYKGLLTGRLKISAASTGKYVIPYFLSKFLELYPGVDLLLDVTNKSQVLASIRNNEVDFALVSVVPDDIDVKEERLLENKLYLIGNQPKFDKNKPLIYREKGSATRAEMERYFSETSSKTRKKLELTSNEAVKQAVIAGLGYSILPIIGIKDEIIDKRLFILPKKNLPLKTDWRLIYNSTKKLSPVARAYLAFIREEKKDILQTYFKWYEDFEG